MWAPPLGSDRTQTHTQTQHPSPTTHPLAVSHLPNCPHYSLMDCPSATRKPLKVPAVGRLVCLLFNLPGSQQTLPLLVIQGPPSQFGGPATDTHTHTHTYTPLSRTHARTHTHQVLPLVLGGLLLCLPLPNYLQKGSLPSLPLCQVAQGVHCPTQLCCPQLARRLAEDRRHSRGVVQVGRESGA